MSQVWFITGSSSGLGRAVAEAALRAGHFVAATARRPERLADLVAEFPETARALPLDVTESDSVRESVAAAVAAFGRLDVVVNNAGFGLLAALEETTDEQIQRNLETNLVGPLRVMREVLPLFRQQEGGRFINISAVAGFANEPGFAVYGATKAALDAASEAVAAEAAPFGVKVTVVAPGPFRTDFISRSLDRPVTPMPEYAATVGKFAALLGRIDGKQSGDPARAAAILRVAADPNPPARLVLGGYAIDKYRKKLAAIGKELDVWEAVGRPTDFPR